MARRKTQSICSLSDAVLAVCKIEALESRTFLCAVPVAAPTVLLAQTGRAGAAGSATVPFSALTPSQLRTAYGVNTISLPNVITADGTGQTIAIVDAYTDPNALSDLTTFDAKFGLANPPSFQELNETGGTMLPATDTERKPDTWELEESLDIEWAHAMAPGANIILFAANSASFSDLFTAVDTAKSTPGVSVVSMSFSSNGDFSGESAYDANFVSNAGQGVTFLAATGDSGGAAGYPAVSPNVVAVGGTSLTTNSTGAYLAESAWSGSSGSLSTQEAQPSYQKGVVTQSTTQRGTPDISMDANPSTGVAVYDSFDGSTTGGNWFQVGGTSLATPMWGGLIAVVNQGRVANGLATYDGATNTLPQLYALPQSDFNDITTGSNARYHAGSGYDLVTGRGTPIANKLVPDLANVNGTPVTPPPVELPSVIGSLTSSANPATQNVAFALTANDVTDSTGTITSISFYQESNRVSGLQTTGHTDMLLGKVTSGGAWSINLTVRNQGMFTFYAVATDSNGLISQPVSVNVVVAQPPKAAPKAPNQKVSLAMVLNPVEPPALNPAFGNDSDQDSRP